MLNFENSTKTATNLSQNVKTQKELNTLLGGYCN